MIEPRIRRPAGSYSTTELEAATMTTGKDERSLQHHPTERRPYEPPAVMDHADFETLALSCGKVGAECQYTSGGPQNS